MDANAISSRRQWAGLALLTLPALLVAVDFSVLYLAVPAITADLHPSSATLLWMVDGYGLLLAAFLVPMGALGDRIGRRRLLLIGAAVFGVGSVIAAEAGSATTLVVTRTLLGVAAATLAPSTLSLISTIFTDSRRRTVAISIWGAALSAGGALGPIVGGVLLARFWWGSVFLLAVPVMAVLLVAGPWLLPEHRNPSAQRTDVVSVALSLVAVLAIVYGLQQIAQDGPAPVPITAVVAGAGAAVVFVRRQRTLAHPLIDLALFRIPLVRLALAANTLSLFVVLGVFLLTAQYLQLVLGLSPLAAGLWSAPAMVALVLGDLATPGLTARFRRTTVLAAGLACAAAGCAVVASVATTGAMAAVVGGMVVLALGIAPVTTLVADLVVGTVPTDRAGTAAALSETTTELGGALGVAVLGSIATVTYRVGTSVLPTPVTPLLAGRVRDSLGGATDAVHALPRALAGVVLATARSAFSAGLGTACAIATVLLVALCLVAVRRGRDAKAGA
jgi:DHA2 family multidrug resistance protein-like MFS transporter